MESKSLLFGIIGFIAGGLLVAIVASTGQPAEDDHDHMAHDHNASMSTDALQKASGDAYDKLFISQMIAHHQGALDMAKLSASRAGHDEIKQLSQTIIDTQTKEIETLRSWQTQWGYVEAH